jgi:hypothetical protein
MTSIPNRAIAEHLSRMSYCVSLRPVATVRFQDRATYANYPFISNQKPPGAILNFLLLFRRLSDIDAGVNCCHAGFEADDLILNNRLRYTVGNVKNTNERICYDFEYNLIQYNSIYRIVTDRVSNSSYIFIPESYIWYLSTEYPNRSGMIVKLQARTYASKPLPNIISEENLPNHMLVLACIGLQSGYPRSLVTMDGDDVDITDLAYMPILCSADEQLIKDVMYSHSFVLEFSLPIEFEVRDVDRIRAISYAHGFLDNAYFVSGVGPVVNYIVQPYNAIRFINGV